MRIRKKTINPQEEIINQKANEFIMKDKIKYYLIEILNDNIDLYDEEDLGPCGFLTDEGECLCHDGYCSDHEWCEKKL